MIMDTVWVRDPEEGFILGHISELLQDGAEIIPLNHKHNRRVATFSDIFQAGDYNKSYDDNCKKNQRNL